MLAALTQTVQVQLNSALSAAPSFSAAEEDPLCQQAVNDALCGLNPVRADPDFRICSPEQCVFAGVHVFKVDCVIVKRRAGEAWHEFCRQRGG